MRRGTPTLSPLKEIDWATLRPVVTETLLADMAQRIVSVFQPRRIILFGSYAYGQPRPDSDVDLLVIMESNDDMAQRMLQVKEVARVPYLPLDVLVYTPAEIEERLAKADFFFSEILEKGKVLYNGDADR